MSSLSEPVATGILYVFRYKHVSPSKTPLYVSATSTIRTIFVHHGVCGGNTCFRYKHVMCLW